MANSCEPRVNAGNDNVARLNAKTTITARHRSRFYSPFAKASLAGRWVYFATRLGRLPHLGTSRAAALGALDFCANFFSFSSFHKIHFLEMRKLILRHVITLTYSALARPASCRCEEWPARCDYPI